MTSIDLSVPQKGTYSIQNAKKVLEAVRQRFPAWSRDCHPYVNVLTMRAWNQRGYRVKKGEKPIRFSTVIPVWKENKETGAKVQVGTRVRTAHVFALPQVEQRRTVFRPRQHKLHATKVRIQRCLAYLRRKNNTAFTSNLHERHLWYYLGFLDALTGKDP